MPLLLSSAKSARWFRIPEITAQKQGSVTESAGPSSRRDALDSSPAIHRWDSRLQGTRVPWGRMNTATFSTVPTGLGSTTVPDPSDEGVVDLVGWAEWR